MKIQIFQFHVEYGNVEKNEQKISEWFNTQLDADTEVVVLPEMWNNGYALEELNEKADQALSRSFPFISNLAQTYQVDIVAGSVSNNKIIKFIILLLLSLKKVVVLTNMIKFI